MRAALLGLVLLPSLAAAQQQQQQKPEDAGKVSNDQPDRPLQMPPASSEAKEAFDDFERFGRRGAWERAAKALYSIPDEQASRFVDAGDGFIISVARKRRTALGGLSPEGQAAYRLFYDADAKKLLEQAEGPAEQATLERIYSAYFPASVGDDAADRLGDLYFEQGRFDRAADCWLAVLRDRADSDLSPAMLAVKAALALARGGRVPEIDAIRREFSGRFGDEPVTLGGRTATAAEHLRRILDDAGTPGSDATRGPDGPPPDPVAASWQFKFGASVTAGMTPPESIQWESNPLSAAVPPVASDGSTLFANYLGNIFALDLATGKLLWRSGSFHNIEIPAMQNQARMIEPGRFAILTAPGYVISLGRDLKDPNFQAPFLLTCRRAKTGDIVWQSADLPDHAGFEPGGPPILGDGVIYLAAKGRMNPGHQGPRQQFAVAIRPHDGKVLWKTEVGTFRQVQSFYSFYGMGDNEPEPRLAYRAGSVYLDTHAGVLARLDAESGELDWGYGYATEPTGSGMSRFFFYRSTPEATTTPGTPIAAGEALILKGAKGEKLAAVDPDRMKLLWDRPIAKSARLIGVDAENLYLGGPELGALDRKARVLRWSTRLPGGSEEARVVVRPDGLWQLTPRGVFEVDPHSGRVRRVFRLDDPGASGGDLLLTDRRLVAVSNRTISAYPRGGAGAGVAVGGGGAAASPDGGIR